MNMRVSDGLSQKNASQDSEQLFKLSGSLCCHRKAKVIVLIAGHVAYNQPELRDRVT